MTEDQKDSLEEAVTADEDQRLKKRWQIEFVVDVQQADRYLKSKDVKSLRPEKLLDEITRHTKKLFQMGVFKRTAIRLFRKRFADQPEFMDNIVNMTAGLYERWLVMRPKEFGKESLLDETDRDSILLEEPSDFPASRLEDTEDAAQGWIIRDMIPDDDAILNQGDGGAGKTTTMLQLAVAVATGREWLGKEVECGPQPVVFFSCEERSKKIKLRIKPLLEGESRPYRDEITWPDLANLHIVNLADRDALIAVKDQSGRITATEMYRFFANKIEGHGAKLVIIDSLYDTYGGDENTRSQVRQFVGMLRRLTARFECALVMLGHPSLYGMASGTGTSGSTGWRNAFRGMLYTTKTKQKNGTETHKIATMKGNYGQPGVELELVWQDGIFVPITQEDAAATKAMGQDAAKAMFLELLASYTDQGRAVSATPTVANYAPRVFADDPHNDAFNKADFADAMNLLFSAGQIELRPYRKENRHMGERIEPTGSPITAEEFDFG